MPNFGNKTRQLTSVLTWIKWISARRSSFYCRTFRSI